MSRELTVDRSLCMGSGQCLMYAPATFDLDETTIAIVVDAYGDPLPSIQTAADSCPTGAITLDDDGQV